MKKHSFAITVAVILVSIGLTTAMLINAQVGNQSPRGERAEPTPMQGQNYKISGPYSHANLAIFLIHGKNLIEGNAFLTLQQALEQKKVIVYETKDVNELAIENRSNQDVYVQAGDIVKGGQQDRMISVDLIVPPRSGRMPLSAFCVEHGRWGKRGSEQAAVFSSSSEVASTKEIKLAAKRDNSQGEVWETVRVAQDNLSQNVGATVNAIVSESSLQLAVENHKVQETAGTYLKALSAIVAGHNDVIGYAFAINGKVNSADVYASSSLFKKLWPKLLKANAVEAIANLQPDGEFSPVALANVAEFLSEAEMADETEQEVTARIRLLKREDERNLFFETRDSSRKDAWIHRNYIRK